MENKVGKGAITLVLSGLICKMFGALFRIPLTNIIGIKGIGIFQMTISLYSLTLVFVSGGVTSALSKLVASARADGDFSKICAYKRTAIFFTTGLGFILGTLFTVFGKQIAIFQHVEGNELSYFLFVILLPLGGLIGTYRGIIQGYENMTPTAISQILEQSIKFAFGLLFAFIFGKGDVLGGVFGAILGITLSEVVAFFYLILIMKKYTLPKSKESVNKEFFSAIIPLCGVNAISPIINAFEAMTIVSLLGIAGVVSEKATLYYGLQTGVVGAIMHFPLIISLSVAIALLPKLSYLFKKDDVVSQREIISKSFEYMWFFLIPLTFGLVALSPSLYPIIYRDILSEYIKLAENLTIISAFSVILSAVMQFLLTLLQAKGMFFKSMLFGVIGGVFKVLSLFILARIPSINIFAIPISNIVFASIVSIGCLISLGSDVKVGAFEFFLPIFSSAVMLLCVRILLNIFSGLKGLIISTFIGGVIYFVCSMPLTIEIFKMFLSKFKFKRRNIC